MLYITSRRFTERTNAVTNVKIYSNAAKVECCSTAFPRRRGDGTNGVFIWKNIKLQPGENKVEARAERAGQSLNDECIWTLK